MVNMPYNQMYSPITRSLAITVIRKKSYLSGDRRYDDHKLNQLSTDIEFQLMCPVQTYTNIPVDRIKLVKFYESNGKSIYSPRNE